MLEIRQTETYSEWFAEFRDARTKARIDIRIRRLSLGNPGDVKPVGKGISEMRIDCGPGYRIYYKHTKTTIIVLLCGGDKDSQQKDIAQAKKLAAELED